MLNPTIWQGSHMWTVPIHRGQECFHWAQIYLTFNEALTKPILKGTLLFPYTIPLVKGNTSVAEDAISLMLFRNAYLYSRYHELIGNGHKLKILSLGTPSSRSTEMPTRRLYSQEIALSLVVCAVMASWRCLSVNEKGIWLLSVKEKGIWLLT